MPENWQQAEICIVINDKSQGGTVGMSYFITNLSFNLLVKEFSKSANIWRSYRQNG